MRHPRVAVGTTVIIGPPAGLLRLQAAAGRLVRADSFIVADHVQSFIPEALWSELTWLRRPGGSHANFDYATFLGALAAHAGGMRLGVGVTDPLRRHPVVVAQTMLTLAHLTRRAPILGIGSGERENLEPLGLPLDHPTDRLEESLQILRACFDGTLGDFDGEYYTLRGALMALRPPQGKVPQIWVGAHGPRMLELTGRYGDGWLPYVVPSPEDYAEKLGAVHHAARHAGRRPEDITASLSCILLLGRDAGQVRALLRSPMARYLALLTPAPLWRSVGAEHPLGPRHRGFVDMMPERLDIAEVRAAMASVPEEVVGLAAMVGTPDQIVDRIHTLAEAGLRHFSPQVLSGAIDRRNAPFDVRAMASIARRLQGGR